jgi:uncharacterized protein (UPF0212 family)
MLKTWIKQTFVCDDTDNCDTLVEVTSLNVELGHAWCPACGKPLNRVSVEDGTVRD